MSEIVHVENVIYKQLFIKVKINVVFRVHSEILERFLLVSNKFSYKVLWHLDPLNFKLV